MSDARAAVLGRVRAALGADPAVPDIPRDYVRAGAPAERDVVARFADRCADYAATVHRCDEDGVATLVAELTAAKRVVASPGASGVLAPYRRQGTGMAPTAGEEDGGESAVDDGTLDAQALDGFDAVLTGCAVAIAETGTIVLDGGAASGRRAITLVPDHHVCVVRAGQVVAGVPDAIAAVRDAVADGRPITFVSGPSATSDIELERVEGVHGPRRLDVVLVA